MANNREPYKMNIPMVVACILFCLTMFSIYLTSNIFAKYTTRASGNDFSRVAGFSNIEITETGDFDSHSAMLIPGIDLAKKAVVTFGPTEVATYIFVEAELSKSWALGGDEMTFSAIGGDISWSIADGWKHLSSAAGATSTVHVYYRELKPNETLSADIIEGGVIDVSENLTRNEMPTENYFINFRATAVQAGGFAKAEDAWASASAG